MFSNGTELSWLVLSPLAVIIDVAAIAIVFHYKPFYHGSDVVILSLLVAMTMNALLVVPFPAVIGLGYTHWNSMLCKFYVWSFLTFRIAQMLSLSAICMHWSSIFRASSNNQNKGLTYRIKILSVIIWILSIIVGLLPIIGAVPDDFFTGNGSCLFLSSDIGIGFTVFMFVFVVACMFIAIISICDVTCLTKLMRRSAHAKYGSGRLSFPKKRSDVPGDGNHSSQEKFYQLNFSWDLCRLFCVIVSFCFICNHLPYVILELMQSVTGFSRTLTQEIILWLILIEALVFPNLLWTFSRRYRHALVYSWHVHIMRRPREEVEDPMSCRLQSYSRKVRDINGHADKIPQPRDKISTETNIKQTYNIPVSPETPDIILEPFTESRIRYDRQDSYSTKSPDIIENETTFSTFHTVETQVHNSSNNLNVSSVSVDRSHSSSSRQEWKEQMKKKHLPPFFTNDSFTAEIDVPNIPPENIERSDGTSGSVHSLYYLSSDYHPDYLNTDSLSRHRLEGGKDRSQSENSSNGTMTHVIEEIDTKLRVHHRENIQNSANVVNEVKQPVSADEIDIYIYQVADSAKRSDSKLVDGNVNEIYREPAEGYNEDDEKLNSQNGECYDVHHQENTTGTKTWQHMVEPILQKNESDELDVSLTSCDPTWQHVRQYKLQNGRPVSHSPFDHETDRGFEEALSVEYERSISSLTNDSFGDSIDIAAPFDFESDFKNETFKTQAIVSKSRPVSCSTVESDNTFDYVPIETRQDVIRRSFSDNSSHKPSFSTFKSSFSYSHNKADPFGDSVFDSDFSNVKTSTPTTNSPWPTIPEHVNTEDNVFESDFSSKGFSCDTQSNTFHDQIPSSDKSDVRHKLHRENVKRISNQSGTTDVQGGLTMDVPPILL